MAKDKLIFIIICSAAIGVAVIALAIFLFGAAESQLWQCLECDDIFKKKTSQLPPIDCPKCSGQAVALRYATCPECGKKVPESRRRLTEQGKAQEEAMRKRQEEGGFLPPPMALMGMGAAQEIQYWVPQSDGSYAWTNWLNAMDPRVARIPLVLKCEKCQALLHPPR
ncbi:MAG: hypothetical protein KAT11_06550 [Phycisphaerae bacterium]|nr:hypothetical protein [Phycisphaerae bacterium]